jgi:hypothetical protein
MVRNLDGQRDLGSIIPKGNEEIDSGKLLGGLPKTIFLMR